MNPWKIANDRAYLDHVGGLLSPFSLDKLSVFCARSVRDAGQPFFLSFALQMPNKRPMASVMIF